ncbi:MAG TPA: LD-carboxypeptidase [Terracidiphilus sp.]|nr:LD-carboxypeptidase [Terracidiphilus sp.]
MIPLLKPPSVASGAAISIIAPASSALPERAERGIQALRKLNFTPRTGRHTLGHGPLYFAGTPVQRLADLHAAFTNKSTHIVASLRGGYGSNYLLENLDLRLIARHPKPFFAYSDLTGAQLLLLDKIGLPAFHGPMVAADFDSEDGVHLPSFSAALAGEPYSLGAAEGLRTLRRGSARGVLYGGCLSILAALVGTPFEPKTEGKILFLEDTGVKPYQVDRLLWQLQQAGKFNRVRGIVFGEMIDCVSPGAPADLLEQTIMHVFRDADFPIAIGLRSGHVSRQNVTLTFGVKAELELGKDPQLRLVEPAVAS